jgi:hypothetical protein
VRAAARARRDLARVGVVEVLRVRLAPRASTAA